MTKEPSTVRFRPLSRVLAVVAAARPGPAAPRPASSHDRPDAPGRPALLPQGRPDEDRRLLLSRAMARVRSGSATSTKMAELGFEFTHFGEFAWAFLEPSDGKFDFAWLDRAVDLAARAGLKVILCTPTPCPPAWLGRKDTRRSTSSAATAGAWSTARGPTGRSRTTSSSATPSGSSPSSAAATGRTRASGAGSSTTSPTARPTTAPRPGSSSRPGSSASTARSKR